MHPKTRSLLLNLARILISVGLMAWVISRAGLDKLIVSIRTADPRPYALAVGLAFVGILLRAVRWRILLNAVNAKIPFRRLAYLYFVGAFFNAFLPTGFGGDVVRVLEIGEGASSTQAAGTTVVDRLTGFIVLFWLALLALPFGANLLPPATVLMIALLSAGVTLGSALLFEGRILRWITAHFPRSLSLTGDAWLGRTYGVITACGWRAIAGALGVSAIFNIMMNFAGLLIARAFGMDVTPWTLFLFIPVATAALLVPISISGLGVREGIFVTLFAQVGIADSKAVAFSLAWYSLDFAMALVGGVVYLAAGVMGLRGK
jgi:uncharacterized membrane protein YbhN (UPF0104 family)